MPYFKCNECQNIWRMTEEEMSQRFNIDRSIADSITREMTKGKMFTDTCDDCRAFYKTKRKLGIG